MKSNKSIEMDQNTITSLLDKLNNRSLDEEDYELIKLIIATVVNVNMELVKKNISIQRLRKLFNIKTEKSTNILPEKEKVNKEKSGEKYDKKEKKGHGRMSSHCYSSAEKVSVLRKHLLEKVPISKCTSLWVRLKCETIPRPPFPSTASPCASST